MLGALIGDIVGSVYEWHNHKSKDFPLFQPDCRMTDDSVMTAAVASAVLMGTEDLAQFQANVVAEMRRLGRQHPRLGYGPRFEAWLANPDPQPYGSLGNGSAMRVSQWPGRRRVCPSAWPWPRPRQRSPTTTRRHRRGLRGGRGGLPGPGGESKAAIADHVTRYYPLDFTLDEIREDYAFDVTCAGSVPQAMEAFLEAESFEDARSGAPCPSAGQRHHRLHGRGGGRRLLRHPVGTSGTRAMAYLDGEVYTIYDRFSRQY